MQQRMWPLILCLALAACGTAATSVSAPTTTPTASPAAVDLAAIRASFTEECADPIIVDAQFCEQVDIAALTVDGDILNVPTGLNANATDRASAICEQIARAHFDGEGNDLGFRYVGILDQTGGNAAACSVD